ncbi:replication factor C subunit 1 [Phlebotomus argentipes]|uniref:replication factor C subunit 1 n=1 Tax=Phlebotomus argentipes TaxID=94469 RepID=UPI0028932D25|nr:replication factor C subunit 1 [Phlebotomus argentipes]
MPRDIRSYFSASSKSSSSVKTSSKDAQSKPSKSSTSSAKKKTFVVSSDDEIPPTPDAPRVKKHESSKGHSKRRRVFDSDDEKEVKKSSKPDLKKLKKEPEVPKKVVKSLGEIFNDKPVEMVLKKQKTPKKSAAVAFPSDDEFDDFAKNFVDGDEKPKKTKTPRKSDKDKEKKTPKKEPTESDFHSDEEFLRTVKALDEVNGKHKTPKKTPKKNLENEKEKSSEKVKKEPKSAEKSSNSVEKISKAVEKPSKSAEKTTKPVEKPPKSAEKIRKPVEKSPKPADKARKEETKESKEVPPEDKKKLAGILYQKFKNRSSCIDPGSKEVPEGAPDCLAGLSFIITGILESLQREEATQLIKDLGGRVMASVSKKTDYVVLGEEAGPAKLKKIEEFGTKKLSEDGLFDLIRQKSVGKIQVGAGLGAGCVKRKADKSPDVGGKKGRLAEEAFPAKKSELNVTGDVGGKLPWVDKYAPVSSKHIIGQQGAASNMVKLTNWLSKWYSNHDGKKKLQRPSPWAKSDDGAFFKAALLSGPPGVGKTTTASLVCRELGFDVVEFNASDTRSKRLLKEQVSELLSNKSLFGFCHNAKVAVSKKHVLLMDEVDGMAGNEDRGGIQELIALIKDSSVPIVCMCNDRNAQKMRSLVNYCYDLRFQRPRAEQIKGAMMSVCFKEKLKLAPGVLDEIIASTNHDVRQTLNILSMLNAKKDDQGTQTGGQNSKKDLKLGPWDVVRKVFSAEEQRKMSIQDRSDLFFHDYSLGPLFVQENYLSVSPRGDKRAAILKVAEAADCLSMGDLVDRRIRSNMAWSLLPTQAIFSSVLPGYFMQGFFTGQIEFPGWLGKNSKRNKKFRLAQEINDHIRITASGSRESVCLDYAPNILAAISAPLKQKGAEGVPEAVNVMKEYRLLREDIEGLVELSVFPGKKSPLDGIDGKVKAALTRMYNKEVCPFVYSANAATKKKKAGAGDAEDGLLNEDGEEVAQQSEEEEEDDKIDNDVLIKAKKKAPAKKEPAESTSKGKKAPSTSKGGRSKKK